MYRNPTDCKYSWLWSYLKLLSSAKSDSQVTGLGILLAVAVSCPCVNDHSCWQYLCSSVGFSSHNHQASSLKACHVYNRQLQSCKTNTFRWDCSLRCCESWHSFFTYSFYSTWTNLLPFRLSPQWKHFAWGLHLFFPLILSYSLRCDGWYSSWIESNFSGFLLITAGSFDIRCSTCVCYSWHFSSLPTLANNSAPEFEHSNSRPRWDQSAFKFLGMLKQSKQCIGDFCELSLITQRCIFNSIWSSVFS